MKPISEPTFRLGTFCTTLADSSVSLEHSRQVHAQSGTLTGKIEKPAPGILRPCGLRSWHTPLMASSSLNSAGQQAKVSARSCWAVTLPSWTAFGRCKKQEQAGPHVLRGWRPGARSCNIAKRSTLKRTKTPVAPKRRVKLWWKAGTRVKSLASGGR